MEILKIQDYDFRIDELSKSQKKAERTIKELTEYFEDFERTQFTGRFITNEYHQKKKDLIRITEYYQILTDQINEKRSKKEIKT